MKNKIVKLSFISFILVLFLCLCACKTEEVPGYKEIDVLNSNISLHVGETSKIEVKDFDETKEYTYRSSNDAVSVDDEGNIVANTLGSAIIFVENDSYEYGCAYVVVSSYMPIDISTLTIDNKVNEMKAKESVTLTYSKLPLDADNYNSIKWQSSDERIATISEEGVVNALAPGLVTISLIATGTEFSDSFDLNVKANPSTLTIDYTNVFGKTNSSDLLITPTLITDYIDVNKGIWTSSDENVVTIDEDGNVSFHNVGKAVLTYTVTTPSENLEAKCNVSVGEKEGYTIIRTPIQLQDIVDTSGNYALGNDIDMEEACSPNGELYHLGAGFTPLFSTTATAFSGTFDGQGYKIKNIMINVDAPFNALIRYINTNVGSEGRIINLALVGGKISGTNFTSSFVGYITGGGSKDAGVKNCWTDVEIVASGSLGGLSGYNGGLIENCYSLSKITAGTDIASVSLFAKNGNDQVGVKNTFINSDIQDGMDCLVLPNRIYNSIIENTYYKTTEEMKVASLYNTWDTTIWRIVDGEYPQLITPND